MEITGNTYRTDNYDQFKRLEGNRAVLAARVNKIKNSIMKNGYIFNPIVVNEKYQIIDGQGRFEAERLLGLPIDYVIAHGAGLEECIVLNASGTIWTMTDYIDSYCEMGNENYIRARKLLNAFPDLSLSVRLCLITGLAAVPNESIKKGSIVVTPQQEEEALDGLRIANRFVNIFKRVRGTPNHYFYAVVFATRIGADQKRLLDTLEKSVLEPAPTLKKAMDNISDIYNKNLRDNKKRIYLYQEYEQTMSNKYGWYDTKWGKDSGR